MSNTSLEIPFSGVPFPKPEYERRQQKVLEAVERAKLDAIVVTSIGHIRYLTGYDGRGAYFAPFPVILVPGREPTFVVRDYEEQAVRGYSCLDKIALYTHQHELPKVFADVLRSYGLASAKVGFELGCWNLAPADLNAIQTQLPDMRVTDATHIVPTVWAVKSPLEIAVMREAMLMTDLAVHTFHRSLREGATELEVFREIESEVYNAGGEMRTASLTLVFGDRTRVAHGAPVRNPIKNNEPALIEIGGAKHGYAAGLVRTAVLGRHPEAEAIHALAEEAVNAAIEAIKPGVTAGEVDAAARKVIVRAGQAHTFRHRTGYQTGINWGERGNMSLEPGASDIIKADMTLHMPIILFAPGGHMVGCSQHVLVTEQGAEVLSSTPHTLFHV